MLFALVHWSVSPDILQIGPFTLRWYGLLFALGFVLGFRFMQGVFQRENKPMADLDRLLVVMIAGTVIGARLGHCLFYDPAYYFSNPLEILKIWQGGLASHGGALGIVFGLYGYARKRPDQPYLWLLDRIVVPTALVGGMIRLGNLFNSEIYGLPTDLPWAFTFARTDPAALPRHPTQIYEALAYFLIFGLLYRMYQKRGAETPRGLLLGMFLVLVFGARFGIEFVKVRQAAFLGDFALSMGQLLSIPAVIIGLILWRRALKTNRP